MKQSPSANNLSAFFTLITVFFFWGFVAASNGIFIPFCKAHFHLDQFDSQLIDASFYGAYFFGSLILFLFSSLTKVDLLNKIGYKNGIIYGLLLSVVGALSLAYISGSGNATFPMVLVSFFIIALGFSLQQTAAQPFVVLLGDNASGAHRLNMAGGVNSFGTLLGPIIVSLVLFGSLNNESTNADISNIKTLYLIMAGLFTLIAIFFAVSKLPAFISDEKMEKSPKAIIALLIIAVPTFFLIFLNKIVEAAGSSGKLYLIAATLVITMAVLFYALAASAKNKEGWGAMAYPQLVLGMIAIFVYVGVEVTIQSNMGALLKQPGFLTTDGLNTKFISPFIALYWGSLMIGRWSGAVSVFNLKTTTKKALMILMPFIAFAVILVANYLRGSDINNLLPYVICICVLVAVTLFSKENPVTMLFSFSAIAAVALLIGMITSGWVATYAIISGGLFCSVMWPCIFSLAIAGLGKYTSQGSAFMIMMILGGAIIPPLQGVICDFDKTSTSLIMGDTYTHFSYIVPVICFAYLAWHALKTKNVLQKQNILFDKKVSNH